MMQTKLDGDKRIRFQKRIKKYLLAKTILLLIETLKFSKVDKKEPPINRKIDK